jgi:hypothetical protein
LHNKKIEKLGNKTNIRLTPGTREMPFGALLEITRSYTHGHVPYDKFKTEIAKFQYFGSTDDREIIQY